MRTRKEERMERISRKAREKSPEMDPLRLGTGWTREDLEKPQIMIESTFVFPAATRDCPGT